MRERSKRFAGCVLREGAKSVRFQATGAVRRRLSCSKSLDLPSVLIEAGYISSPDDARALASSVWRRNLRGRWHRLIEIYLAQTAAAPAGL